MADERSDEAIQLDRHGALRAPRDDKGLKRNRRWFEIGEPRFGVDHDEFDAGHRRFFCELLGGHGVTVAGVGCAAARIQAAHAVLKSGGQVQTGRATGSSGS